MNYACHLLVYLSIYTIVAQSLNLVVGYCGLISLCHAGYFAIGSYAYAIASKAGYGFVTASALGVSVGLILSLAVSLPAWMFKGDFFLLISLAVQIAIADVISNWVYPTAEPGTLRNLTNGPYGIAAIPRPHWLGHRADTMVSMAILALATAGLCMLITFLLVRSPWGRLLKCIRDDELASRGLGKPVRYTKLQAFAVSCGMAALAGSLYASYVGYIDPSSASLDNSLLMLSMVLVGGTGNFQGPVVGAATLLAFPEILRLLHIPAAAAANLRLMAYGLLLILLVHLRPQGIAGERQA
ncbi:MAG: branched-chain amino acid ABC transporter permease [Armatimonadetes bacterium]|nr:branched-chain amino acid ABC transporter permease [Armatimonadota bacterium]